ncbi:MAG: DUF6133 family protein [Clostridiales bacterium]|nr:hypothetical protein [Clostridiales bacterium]MDU3242923.1 DUF6133 family protein [Clostridiales bacterium]
MKRKINNKMIQIRTKMVQIVADKRGEGFVDTAIKILISVVIGALLLAGLYALFNDSILPELQNRIQQMFSYSG